MDPAGTAHYGPNWIKSLRIGDIPANTAPSLNATREGTTTLTLTGVPVVEVLTRHMGNHDTAQPLWKGKRLGQRFRSDWQSFIQVEAVVPTWSTSDSGFTLTLRREGPTGGVIARKTFRNHRDATPALLQFPPQPRGMYYLEMSDPVGSLGGGRRKGRGAVARQPS